MAEILRSGAAEVLALVRSHTAVEVTPAATTAGTLRRLELLEDLDAALADARATVADARAALIAGYAGVTSSRQAAKHLGLSVAAVAKATARVRMAVAS